MDSGLWGTYDSSAHDEIRRLNHRIKALEATVEEMQRKFDSIQEWSDYVTAAVNGMAVHTNYEGASNDASTT